MVPCFRSVSFTGKWLMKWFMEVECVGIWCISRCLEHIKQGHPVYFLVDIYLFYFVLFLCLLVCLFYSTSNPGPYTYSGNLFSLCWILSTDGWKFVKQMLSPLMNLYIFLEKFAEITRIVVKIHSLEQKRRQSHLELS